MERRDFLHSIPLLGAMSLPGVTTAKPSSEPIQKEEERAQWVRLLSKIADPLLSALSQDILKEKMPVEARTPEIARGRKNYTYLEGFGRLLSGIGPWLILPGDSTLEGKVRSQFFALTQASLTHAVNPGSKDMMNFSEGPQPLVDAAFLALGLIRAPQLWKSLDEKSRQNLLLALRRTRTIKPYANNWLLFSGMIEAFFLSVGEEYDKMRLDYAIRQHDQWYKGDGIFGDGPEFHWDYYNSYVIQPFLTTILHLAAARDKSYAALDEKYSQVALRYAEILERLVAPDGSFPVIGRSIVYRCGAYHHLSHQVLLEKLPKQVTPAQVRAALGAVIHRTLDDEKNFDSQNWLRLGLCAHQPGLAEEYISTGSLYLCATAFLPLGLPATHEFWSSPSVEWTGKKVWGGADVPADKALKI
ncbi:MAG: DUF2264 domain-containing protein [bacterium]